MEKIQIPEIARAEARLPRWMLGVTMAGVLAIVALGKPQAALAFLLGAGIATINYFWLRQAVETLFSAGHIRVPRRVLLKFSVRHPLALVGVYWFYKTGWLPAGPILAGLFVPAAGVLLEGIIELREGFRT